MGGNVLLRAAAVAALLSAASALNQTHVDHSLAHCISRSSSEPPCIRHGIMGVIFALTLIACGRRAYFMHVSSRSRNSLVASLLYLCISQLALGFIYFIITENHQVFMLIVFSRYLLFIGVGYFFCDIALGEQSARLRKAANWCFIVVVLYSSLVYLISAVVVGENRTVFDCHSKIFILESISGFIISSALTAAILVLDRRLKERVSRNLARTKRRELKVLLFVNLFSAFFQFLIDMLVRTSGISGTCEFFGEHSGGYIVFYIFARSISYLLPIWGYLFVFHMGGGAGVSRPQSSFSHGVEPQDLLDEQEPPSSVFNRSDSIGAERERALQERFL